MGSELAHSYRIFNRPTLLVVRLLPWLLLLGVGVAAYPSLTRDLWTDEAFTASYTTHPGLGELLEDVRKNEETPPLYFVTVWLWAKPFGHSEAAIRGLSLLCGGLALLGFARLVRGRLESRAATTAIVVLALTPLLQRYLVEARGYTLTLLLAVVCVAAFEWLRDHPQLRAAQVSYALAAAALFLTSYFGVALLAAQWLAWLFQLRDPGQRGILLRSWAIVQLICAACILPWLPSLLYQLQVAPAVTANWSSGLADYYLLALSLFAGEPLRGPFFVAWLCCAAASWALALAALLRARAHTRGLLLRTMFLPAAILLALALVMQVVAARYLLVLLPGAALAAGIGFDAVYRQRRAMAWLLAGSALCLMLVCRAAAPAPLVAKPWSQLVAQLAAQANPVGDLVIMHPPWDQRVFEYYYTGPALPILGAHHYDDFYYTQGYQLTHTWTLDEALPLTRGYRRVWVFYDQIHHRVPVLALPYAEVGHWRADKLELILYALP